MFEMYHDAMINAVKMAGETIDVAVKMLLVVP